MENKIQKEVDRILEKYPDKPPKIGVSLMVFKNRKILVGERIGSHGANTWHFPGGHVEPIGRLKYTKEEYEEAVIREVYEETGLKNSDIGNLEFVICTDDYFDKNTHYITVFYKCDHVSGKPHVMEPDKCKKWIWVDWYNIPKPHFLPVENLLKTGYNPFKN